MLTQSFGVPPLLVSILATNFRLQEKFVHHVTAPFRWHQRKNSISVYLSTGMTITNRRTVRAAQYFDELPNASQHMECGIPN
jgi:hypothetical protein